MPRKAKRIGKENVIKFSKLIESALNEESEGYSAKELVHQMYDDLKQIIHLFGYERATQIFEEVGLSISKGTLQNYMSAESESRKSKQKSKQKGRRLKLVSTPEKEEVNNEEKLKGKTIAVNPVMAIKLEQASSRLSGSRLPSESEISDEFNLDI